MNKAEWPAAAIEELIIAFSDKSLAKSNWTHEAHLLVALWHNWHMDFQEAFETVKTKIITYNEAVGTINDANSGYHETLTIFWMLISANFLKVNNYSNLEEACNAFLASPFASKYLPLTYYSKAHLFTTKARKEWVDGDKQILSF